MRQHIIIVWKEFSQRQVFGLFESYSAAASFLRSNKWEYTTAGWLKQLSSEKKARAEILEVESKSKIKSL